MRKLWKNVRDYLTDHYLFVNTLWECKKLCAFKPRTKTESHDNFGRLRNSNGNRVCKRKRPISVSFSWFRYCSCWKIEVHRLATTIRCCQKHFRPADLAPSKIVKSTNVRRKAESSKLWSMNSEKGTEEIRERDFILEAPVISPFSISQHFLPACKNVRNFSPRNH